MSDQRKLLDYWLPPESAGRAVACLATTFTFDPDFFESDCLGRFLGMDWKRGEGDDLAYLIEEEERLAEARVAAIVDRSYSADNRNLRWDILPVGQRGALMHAKVAILIWERHARFLVTSANLTRSAYRQQVETAIAFDADHQCQVPGPVFHDLISAVRRLVMAAAGANDSPGPKLRALEILDLALTRVRLLRLPDTIKGSRLRVAVGGGDGRPALQLLRRVWSGGPPRQASILSPFFDRADPMSPTKAVLAELAQRGERTIDFVVPVDRLPTRTVARAPREITEGLPASVWVGVYEFKPPDGDDVRRLHAKVVLVQSDSWTAVMIGSSNFTCPGLALSRPAHLEINVALGAPAGSKEAKAFEALVPWGDEIEVESAEWEPEPSDEETVGDQLPWGFAECLVEPTHPPNLVLRLHAIDLPAEWRVELPTGVVVAESATWKQSGAPAQLRLSLADPVLPFWVQVRWRLRDQWTHAAWAVNVTEPGKLPPPQELRDLPVDAILDALASTRPLHEALSAALKRRALLEGIRSKTPDLDPLRRFSSSGLLLHRARKVSAALAGLRRRLERPAASIDTLEWRLTGRFGPRAIAKGLVNGATEGRSIPGEAAFLLAEVALTLARVDWTQVRGRLPEDQVNELVTRVLGEIRSMCDDVEAPAAMKSYVKKALAAASS